MRLVVILGEQDIAFIETPAAPRQGDFVEIEESDGRDGRYRVIEVVWRIIPEDIRGQRSEVHVRVVPDI